MAGAVHNRNLREARAYCEGRAANRGGEALSANPHPVGTPAHDEWDDGHASWDADPAGVARDDCADEYGGGYTP